ncbi:hypothetical protein F4780DRAFT_788792 [Xylariomycetidae sp. FL0641]|nr:hypothetical protein F4780DRAFT_788792 [Xylariomycetidae sp. FL0641]
MGYSRPERPRWRLLLSGWRLTALANTAALSVLAVLLAALLVRSTSAAGGLRTTTALVRDACGRTRTAGLWLRLALNAACTGVLGCASFLGQVAAAPTRGEVDAGHAAGRALAIGVPAAGNLARRGAAAAAAGAACFLAAAPLHWLANAALLETDFRGGRWDLALASAAFVHDAAYFAPGAVLLPPGGGGGVGRNATGDAGYGGPATLDESLDPGSAVSRYLRATATEAGGWKRLDVPGCRAQYDSCHARVHYEDVVMVVESANPARFMANGTAGLGWTRDGLMGPLDDEQKDFWNPRVPAEESNALFWTGSCKTTSQSPQGPGRCTQTCNAAVGNPEHVNEPRSADTIPDTYEFDFLEDGVDLETGSLWPGLAEGAAATLTLQYCLAREVEPQCKIELVNETLFSVLMCVLALAVVSVFVTFLISSDDALVLPGDAIVSFMTRPDITTRGCCTLDRTAWKCDEVVGKDTGKTLRDGIIDAEESQPRQRPRQWELEENRRWWRAIPLVGWLASYVLFGGVIVILGAAFHAARQHNPYWCGSTSIAHSANSGVLAGKRSLIQALLLANAPQLLLSLSYYMYNWLYTMLCVEKEWNSYSREYRPLRVTDPKGEQVSSWRLQLPYRYSAPLLSFSALLHFLVSSALYALVLEGGYYEANSTVNYTGLSDDALIFFGYSTVAIVVVLVLAILLALLPIILALRRINGAMVLGGSSSMVISAACHFSPVPEAEMGTTVSVSAAVTKTQKRLRRGTKNIMVCHKVSVEGVQSDEVSVAYYQPDAVPSYTEPLEMQMFLDSMPAEDSYAHKRNSSVEELMETVKGINAMEVDDLEVDGNAVIEISQGRVRWGALKGAAENHRAMGGAIGHLGFGSKEYDVDTPIEGHWYM